MTSELQQERKQREHERADMQPYDWNTKRQSLIDSKLVDDRQQSRPLDTIKRSATQYYELTRTGLTLKPMREPEEYLKQLWWPVANESAVIVPR